MVPHKPPHPLISIGAMTLITEKNQIDFLLFIPFQLFKVNLWKNVLYLYHLYTKTSLWLSRIRHLKTFKIIKLFSKY